MISVILPTRDSAARLVQVLTLLVPAAVDGLVKEVVFADAGSTDATLAIAEDSGARVVQVLGDAGTRLAAGVATARGSWILALGEDLSLPEAWRVPVEAHLAGGGGKPAWIAAPGPLGLPGRLLAVLVKLEAIEAAGGFRPGGDPLKASLGRLKPRAVRLRV
ncbi:glycosyltransferase [Caulobacter sp. Root655]|uniref:glycosyltransferase n=1 Tax=Caulobacter sp. Root655 TaxID=1736578 RepID=UPI0006FF625B|nr:glycosyltransferase [Caulobacter sp. Root655]KRA60439.1 glycosyltransferase [Caulobacter sp. Root655]